MPSYTLYYFNGRGRAEICRLMFVAAGVQFKDKRIEFNEWNAFKSKMPCSMLPVLEIDGKMQIPQSMAIARFLAREFGFHGKTNVEMAKVDYICDCFYDLFHDYMRMYHEKNGKIRNELHHGFVKTCLRVLPFMEKTLALQNRGSQFFMGNEMKICDMMCYCALENPLKENANLLNEFPKLKALMARVASHPKIAAYFSKRSKTDF